ncbi:hypothetical protein [Nitrosomonas halophila]|uniref:hypothetical protein n=1 Tax=Nitrosomonas halophila TaxID=44576 RepID=UPI000A8EBDAB|nr:hypothetical protein [Nitrosomonas halophila]
MKYFYFVIVFMAIALSACDSKKHPMDKPPPSAFIEREAAPNDLDADNGSSE